MVFGFFFFDLLFGGIFFHSKTTFLYGVDECQAFQFYTLCERNYSLHGEKTPVCLIILRFFSSSKIVIYEDTKHKAKDKDNHKKKREHQIKYSKITSKVGMAIK